MVPLPGPALTQSSEGQGGNWNVDRVTWSNEGGRLSESGNVSLFLGHVSSTIINGQESRQGNLAKELDSAWGHTVLTASMAAKQDSCGQRICTAHLLNQVGFKMTNEWHNLRKAYVVT